MTEEQEEKHTEIEEVEKSESPPALSADEELKECQDRNLRLLAEMENMRKRLQKEKVEMTRFAVERFITEIITPLDNLENALKFTGQMSDETRQWSMGFEMILTQFKEILSSNGVTTFDSEGKIFDPHIHQAIETEETDAVPEGTILKEFARGYRSGERTIRPARVKIAKKIKPNKENED